MNSLYFRFISINMNATVLLIATLASLASLAYAADDASPLKDVEITEPKDRSLHVRNIPGVLPYSSKIYEIPMPPYHFVSTVLETRQVSRSRDESEANQREAGIVIGAVRLV
jgi:hypothetical protein